MDKNQKWTRIKNRQDSKVDIKIFFNFQFLKLKLPICQSNNKVVCDPIISLCTSAFCTSINQGFLVHGIKKFWAFYKQII